MGRSFKLKFQSNNNKYKKKEEKFLKYNHIYKLQSNPLLIQEFKKNMDIPSYLWDRDEESFYKCSEKYDPEIFKDKGSCCQGEDNTCICCEP